MCAQCLSHLPARKKVKSMQQEIGTQYGAYMVCGYSADSIQTQAVAQPSD